jgi:aspartate kinase
MISVLKFGGSSLKDEKSRQKVATIISETKGKVVVVVSAIGRYPDAYATETLRSLISKKVTISENNRLLSVGEIISSVILSDTLLQRGVKAISLSSVQAGLKVIDKTLIDVDINYINKKLERYDVVIIPGFQGINEDGDIRILESGDSDYSAVYIAQKLGLNHVYLYSDVCGIYTGDPKYIISARLIPHVSYEQALDLSKHKARIICQKALQQGMHVYGFKIYLCSSFIPECHTCVDGSETHIKTMSIDFKYWLLAFDEEMKKEDQEYIFEKVDTYRCIVQENNIKYLQTKYTKVEEYVKVHFVGCHLEGDEIYRVFLERFCQKSLQEKNSYYVNSKNQKQDITLLHDIIVKEE